MELIEAQVLDFSVMEVEISQWSYLVTLLSTANVPNRQFAVIAASDDLSFFMRIPLKRVSFSLMS